MKKATSFINERTAELLLVPKVLKLLATRFEKIIPVYYMATREGGVNARTSFSENFFRVVAMYPRRPKVTNVDTQIIEMKVNHLLSQQAEYLASENIRTFISLPIVTGLDFFDQNTLCGWYTFNEYSDRSFSAYVNSANGDLIGGAVDYLSKINESVILDFAEDSGLYRGWDSFIKIQKLAPRTGRSFWGLPIYKPIYFICFD